MALAGKGIVAGSHYDIHSPPDPPQMTAALQPEAIEDGGVDL
jgi:hypothetical protein